MTCDIFMNLKANIFTKSVFLKLDYRVNKIPFKISACHFSNKNVQVYFKMYMEIQRIFKAIL